MTSLLRLECKQRNSSKPFPIRIFLFLSYSFEIETINTFIHSSSSNENRTQFQTKTGKVYTRFQTKMAQKSIPDGAAHTFIAYIREYSTLRGRKRKNKALHCSMRNSQEITRINHLSFALRFLLCQQDENVLTTLNTLTEIELKTRTQTRFGQRLAWVLFNLGEMCARRFSNLTLLCNGETK